MPLPQPPPPPPPPPVTLVGSDSGTFGEFAQVTSAADSVRDMHKVFMRTTNEGRWTFTPIGPGPAPLALGDGEVILVNEDVFRRKWELSYAEAAAKAKADEEDSVRGMLLAAKAKADMKEEVSEGGASSSHMKEEVSESGASSSHMEGKVKTEPKEEELKTEPNDDEDEARLAFEEVALRGELDQIHAQIKQEERLLREVKKEQPDEEAETAETPQAAASDEEADEEAAQETQQPDRQQLSESRAAAAAQRTPIQQKLFDIMKSKMKGPTNSHEDASQPQPQEAPAKKQRL